MKGAFVALFLAAIVLMSGSVVFADQTYQEVSVTTAYGVTMTTDNGQLVWSFPQNAYGDNYKIRYTPKTRADFPTAPTNTIWAADPFNLDITVDGGSVGLNIPSTVVVRYNPADLGGRSEAALTLYRDTFESKIWAPVPTTVDTVKKTVTAQVADPGNYGLAVSNAVPTAAPALPTAAPTAAPTATPPPAPTAVPTAVPPPVPTAPPAPPSFKLGFATLASIVPDVVGQPVENEHYGPNGDSLQQTTKGLMVWRKADNWTAFTNGSRTWVNGPFGVMERGNDERFDWEK